MTFVERVTCTNGPDYVDASKRIAVPVYFQLAFAIDSIKALAPQHPNWNDTPPFDAVLAGNPA